MDNINPKPPSPDAHKRRALAFLVGGLVLLFVLATSLPNLRLWSGEPFALPTLQFGGPQGGGTIGDGAWLIALRILLAVSLVLLPVALIWTLINKDRRNRFLLYLVVLGLLYWLVTNIVPRGGALQADRPAPVLRPPLPEAASQPKPLPTFTNTPSDTAVWLTTLAVVVLIVACAAGLIWLIARRQRPSPLQELASGAQDALNAIQAGGPLEETIVRCYRDMCAVLQSERNVERSASMTPSEFVRVLQSKGLPIQPFQQLTRLFEELRYGGGKPGPREEQHAIESLTAIVAACQRGRGATGATGAA